MRELLARVDRLVASDDGQDLLEYGLLATLIAVFAATAVTALGDTVNTVFWEVIADAL